MDIFQIEELFVGCRPIFGTTAQLSIHLKLNVPLDIVPIRIHRWVNVFQDTGKVSTIWRWPQITIAPLKASWGFELHQNNLKQLNKRWSRTTSGLSRKVTVSHSLEARVFVDVWRNRFPGHFVSLTGDLNWSARSLITLFLFFSL